MGIGLSHDTIDDFKSCTHRELLAYVSYPPSEHASRCFSYPQYALDGDALVPLEPGAFPDNGCLPMVASQTTPAKVRQRYGDLVVMTVNDEHPRENHNYPDKELARYNSIIDPDMPRGKSAVEFAALSRHWLSGQLMQVLEVQEGLEASRPLTGPVHPYPDQAAPQTKLVLVAQTAGGLRSYLGPFEATCACGSGAVTLRASSAFDMRVAAFDAASFAFDVEMRDGDGDVVARFVDAEEFAGRFEACDSTVDWISDAELLDAIGRISKLGEDPLTTGQARSLKAKVARALEEDAKVKLTPQRRARMTAMLDACADWTALPSEVKDAAIEAADPAQLAEYVLENDHFRGFYDKVMDDSRVRERVEQQRERLSAQKAECEREAREAAQRLDGVKAELASYSDRLEEKRRQLSEEMAAKTAAAHAELDRLTAQVGRLEEERASLEEGNEQARRQIRKTVEEMSDEVLVSGKILESELVKQVVASLGAARGAEEDALRAPVAPAAPPVVLDDSDAEPAAVLREMVGRVNAAGRDMVPNDVANALICLAQGYIVTFAGLPGTGKTSFANILAGALGLKNASARRFVEVPVERGWTSYRDFIGYYNPLTKELEKSNPAVFDALASLDAEAAAGLADGQAAPYLFLLDEANLSSIEHYWSPFLRACDSFRDGPYALALGGSSSFSVPGYARFVATVNFDHTTEELSPRFLDRSWVVTLDPMAADFDEAPAGEGIDFGQVRPLSYAAFQRAFGPRAGAILEGGLSSKLKEVLDLCAGHGHAVSPRSRKMMHAYACTAAELMDRSSAQAAYAPVDYALTQKMLPQLSGTEGRLAGLLDELSRVGGLPLMKARVDHMIEAGSENGFYQYFA